MKGDIINEDSGTDVLPVDVHSTDMVAMPLVLNMLAKPNKLR